MTIESNATKNDNLEITKQFFANYNEIKKEFSPLNLDNYLSFFEKAKALLNHNQKISDTLIKSPLFFNDYELLRKKLIQSGMTINLWDLLSLERNELKNCRILAWLLQENGSHGFGNKFFISLFKNTELIHNFQNHYHVSVEKIFNKDITNRIDICIKNKDFLFFIEAKIDSKELEGYSSKEEKTYQLTRYHRKLEEFSIVNKKLFYLTTNGELPLDDSIRNDIEVITWKDIANALNITIKNHDLHSDYHHIMFNQLVTHFKNL